MTSKAMSFRSVASSAVTRLQEELYYYTNGAICFYYVIRITNNYSTKHRCFCMRSIETKRKIIIVSFIFIPLYGKSEKQVCYDLELFSYSMF